MTEEWRDIEHYRGLYQVSNLGRVRSLRFHNGRVNREREVPLIRKPVVTNKHLSVSLNCVCGVKLVRIHVLVLQTFVGPRPPRYHGAHLDGNAFNNRVDNLAWVTAKENEAHKKSHGTAIIGERHPQAILTADKVRAMRRERANNPSRFYNARGLASKYGVSVSTARKIITNQLWVNV